MDKNDRQWVIRAINQIRQAHVLLEHQMNPFDCPCCEEMTIGKYHSDYRISYPGEDDEPPMCSSLSCPDIECLKCKKVFVFTQHTSYEEKKKA